MRRIEQNTIKEDNKQKQIKLANRTKSAKYFDKCQKLSKICKYINYIQ